MSLMKLLRMIFASLALAIAALPAVAEELSLDQISRYLNDLKSAQADFTQINADGTLSTGTIFIKRPGRARFEYNPPDEALVIAGGSAVAIFDSKSNTGPTQYPLDKTPLKLILQRNVDLGRENMVVGHEYDGTATSIIAQDPEHPEYGSIRLMFSADPIELRQWVITDDVGDETTVILGAMDRGVELGAVMFSITHEIDKRGIQR
jgi:outer membrane lipoprotein-sorting protein